MKRMTISLLALLLTAVSTFAQYQPGSRHLTIPGGWSLMNIEESSNSVGGFETAASFEQISFNGKWAYGAAVSFIRVTDDVANARAKYRTTPFTFQGKYIFGSAAAKGFIQANVRFIKQFRS